MGCFTKQTSVGIVCGGVGNWQRYADDSHWCICGTCGNVLAARPEGSDWGYTMYCNKITGSKTVYIRNCGHIANEILGATILY